MRRPHYEEDPETFTADYYRHVRMPGVAFYVRGWETEPDQDTEWSGQEVRTGRVIAVMVGDDYKHRCDPEDLIPIERKEFCGGCGQIGCHCDAYEEEEATA
jgi:hypothetical protein